MTKVHIFGLLRLLRVGFLFLADDDSFSNEKYINSLDFFPFVYEELPICVDLHVALFYHILHRFKTQLFDEESEHSLPYQIPQNGRIFGGGAFIVLLRHDSEDMFRDLQIRLCVFFPVVEIRHKGEVALL